MANLLPNKVFKGRNADGSKFTVEEWDLGDLATIDAFKFVYFMAIGCVASAFIPAILTAMAIYHYNGRAKIFYIFTALVSAYFIYDANHGWLVTRMLEWFFEESSINVLVSVTTTCLVLNLIFLFVGGMLYNMIEKASEEVSTRWLIFLAVVGFIGMLTYNITVKHYDNKKGWVRAKLEEGLEFSVRKKQ